MIAQLRIPPAVKCLVEIEKRLESTMSSNPTRKIEYLLNETRLAISQLIDADRGFQAGEFKDSVAITMDAHARLGRILKVIGGESPEIQSN